MKRQVVIFFSAVLLALFVHPFFAIAGQALEKKDYTIGPEDVLEIRVLGQQELQRTVEVSQEGTISFPLVGRIVASGRTPFELEEVIEQKLAADKYLLGAQVSIEVTRYGSQKVYLLGEVENPGRFFLKGKTHVFSILAEAGGLTDDAGRTIILIRGYSGSGADQQKLSGSKIITVDLDDIIQDENQESSFVLPGDTIKVPEAPQFYVTGEVNNTGEFKWEKQLSVRRAVAMAGGPTRAGALGRITIQRFENSAEVEIQPQMTDMVKPKDIIIIPQSYF